MPRKKDGILFEIHPSPAKGKDGKSIVYVRPAGNLKLSMRGLEDYCNRNYRSLYGEIERSFDYFLRAAGELMAMGYRIETPIGSFAPRLRLLREITDPDEVKGMDVVFDGVDYNPGKLWKESFRQWLTIWVIAASLIDVSSCLLNSGQTRVFSTVWTWLMNGRNAKRFWRPTLMES